MPLPPASKHPPLCFVSLTDTLADFREPMAIRITVFVRVEGKKRKFFGQINLQSLVENKGVGYRDGSAVECVLFLQRT